MTAARWLLPSVLLSTFAVLCATSLLQKSATYDESYALGVGSYWLTHGSREIAHANLHPPLAGLIHGIPLLFVDVPEEIWRIRSGARRGRQLIALRDDDWILNSARLAMLPVGIFLGCIVFAWSRALYGYWPANISLALMSLCPNLIAHARLVTTDTTLTLFTVWSGYRVWRLAEAPSRVNFALAGLGLGLLLLSKYTALLLIPLLIVADLVFRVRSRGHRAAVGCLLAAGRTWAGLLALAAGVLWAGYLFEVGAVRIAPGLELFVPAPDYIEGALFQWGQSQAAHAFFLIGEISQTGWWYFYLVVLAIKVPIAIQLAFGLLLLGLVGGWRGSGLQGHAREVYLWLPALLLLVYMSLFNTIHNGFRYIMPVYPLILVWIGQCAKWRSPPAWLRPALFGSLLWLAAATLRIWPDYLAYHNEWIGGPRRAYEWSSDANLDWGQDLKQLKRYLEARGIPRVQLAYFGTADPHHYDIDYEYLPSPNSELLPTPPRAPGEKPAPVVAVSAYQYQGVGGGDYPYQKVLRRLEPNDLVGYSILIFDLRNPIPRFQAD